MAFDWEECLKLSRHLTKECQNCPNEEAALRSAVSRAYYAAFCYALRIAKKKYGYVPADDQRDNHGKLQKHLRAMNKKELALKLNDLRQWRNNCDYDDDIPPDAKGLAERAIYKAEYVFQKFR